MKPFVLKTIIIIFLGATSSALTYIISKDYYEPQNPSIKEPKKEEPQISIPYAKNELKGKEIINKDGIGVINISPSEYEQKKNLITSLTQLLDDNMCVKPDTSIPANSYLYESAIIPCNEIKENSSPNIKKGYTLISFKIKDIIISNDLKTKDYVDLYIINPETKNYEKFITSVEVFAIEEEEIILSVLQNGPDNLISLIKNLKDLKISFQKGEIGEIKIINEYLYDYIINKTNSIPDDVILY